MHKRFLFGFTVVELMVVIVGISILASIVLVSYNGMQDRADNTAVQTDLTKIADELNIYYSNKGRYPIIGSELQTIDGVKVARGSYDLSVESAGYCTEVDVGTDMVVFGKSKSGDVFYVKNEDGVKLSDETYAETCNVNIDDPAYLSIYKPGTGWMANF